MEGTPAARPNWTRVPLLLSDRRLARINRAVVSGRILPYLVLVTLLITVLSAAAVRVFAHNEFTTFGESLWWAAQTVTTVGYGDVLPQTAFSKVVAVCVMFFGVAAVSLVTAIVTSAVMSSSQHRLAELAHQDPHRAALERIEQRLEQIEKRL
jgi:voltage-gated potassium channel